MAQSQCPLCNGTGWRLVERVDADQKAERVVQRKDATPGASVRPPKLAWAVPCDCSEADRASRSLARARIPRRYEHCRSEERRVGKEWESRVVAAWLEG